MRKIVVECDAPRCGFPIEDTATSVLGVVETVANSEGVKVPGLRLCAWDEVMARRDGVLHFESITCAQKYAEVWLREQMGLGGCDEHEVRSAITPIQRVV